MAVRPVSLPQARAVRVSRVGWSCSGNGALRTRVRAKREREREREKKGSLHNSPSHRLHLHQSCSHAREVLPSSHSCPPFVCLPTYLS